MSGIDWSKAPEGATHAGFAGEDLQFYRIPSTLGGDYDYFSIIRKVWRDSTGSPLAIELVPHPSLAWNGEGLPPVGAECEYQRNDVIYKQAWVAVTPRYIGESITVLKHSASGNEFTEMTTSCVYRPIRTPEQIAADEREAAVNGMLCYDALGGSRRGLAEALYDAGYRKQEQPK